MAVVINSSAAALYARRIQERSVSALAVSLQRLSSGLRINSARDDAAGLAISERMTSQVRGMQQAIRNANDAISLFQSIDGLAGQLSNTLQRIRELAVQSANGTNSAADRSALDREVQFDLLEFNRAASSAEFNGTHLADGSMGTVTFQLGSNAGDALGISVGTDLRRAALGALESVVSTDLRVVGAFAFDGTYTTVAMGGMDFSRAASAFVGGSITTAGTPAFDYSAGQTAVFTVDGATVTLNANYGGLAGVSNAVQTQLNTSSGGEYVVSTVGSTLKITKTNTASNGAAAVGISAVSGAGAAAFSGGTQASGTLAASASQAGFSVDGHGVALTANHAGDVAGLIADIQLQLDGAATGAGAYVVGGDANGISIRNAAGVNKPAVGGFTGTGATVFASAPVVTVTLGAGDFHIQVGTGVAKGITGSFSNVAMLAAAVNAQGLNIFGAINSTTGALEITSSESIVLSGAQAGSGGLLGFANLTSSPSGSLAIASVLDTRTAGTTMQRVDAALRTIGTVRAAAGANQNRMESILHNLRTSADTTAAARGRILDTDYATETSSLTRNQLLAKAGVVMLAQANVEPNMVLSLLR